MKCSDYNFVIPICEEDFAIYNSRSNALAVINKKELEAINNLENVLDFGEYKDIIEDFKKGDYIIDSDVDELKDIEYRLLRDRYRTDSLTLVIAPTAQCNFRCTYCYEKDNLKNAFMSKEVEEDLTNYVSNVSRTISNLNVCWYGGEPLLAIETIKSLSEKFIEICNSKDVVYSAYMVSNGYLLNRKNILNLNKLSIYGIQITIDGDKKSHDSKRILINGKGTYDTILKNLRDNIDILPHITLRVNLDRDNINSQYDLVEKIYSFDKNHKIHINIAKIENNNGTYEDCKCFSDEEFYKYELEYIKKTEQEELINRYPLSKSNFCGADSKNSVIINYDGKAYKCWSDIGIESRCVGKIENSNLIYNQNKLYFDYILYNPIEDDECRRCKYLPICMGGCPYDRVIGGKKKCLFYKYQLDKYIKSLVEGLI